MGYLGNEPITGHFPVQTNLAGNGSVTTFTLDRAPATAGAIEVSVAGVLQPTTVYSVSGTTLTLPISGSAIANTIPIFIRYLGETLILPTIADGVVTTAKLATDAVTIAKLAATGTASSTTFLRGDNSWAAAGTVNATVDTMTGDGSDVTLALSVSPGSENNVQITFDGVTQHHSTFSLSGSTITFSTAPATGVAVEAISGQSTTTGTPDDNTVNLAQLASGTDGELFTWDASGNPAKVAVGSSGQVLTSAGAGAPPTFAAAGGGKILQVVNTTSASVATGTTALPADTTVPQISEGDQYLSLAITPANASNILYIIVNAMLSNNSEENIVMALFNTDKHATNAQATAPSFEASNTSPNMLTLVYWIAAGTTSATTWRMRAGGHAGGTTTFNGSNTNHGYGTAGLSTMTIWEIEV